MLALAIVAIAVLGMVWNVDPVLRPYIDVAMLGVVCLITFTMGVRFDDWLTRLAAKPPRWRKVRHPKGRQPHSGASMPLLER